MLIAAKTLMGYDLDGLDGDMGTVKDALFDDRQWSVRYLVADTGSWLPSKKVLISPCAVRSVSALTRRVGIAVTRQQIEESPSLLSRLPVSRPFEAEYCAHFRWPLDAGGSGSRGDAPASDRCADQALDPAPPSPAACVPVLRSTRDVIGLHLLTSDGEIGQVEDVIIDDGNWAIRYVIADTRTWWPGVMVLIAPQYIERVNWDVRLLTVSLTRAAISAFRSDAGPDPIPDDGGNGPQRHGDHARPGRAGDHPGRHDRDRDPATHSPGSSAPAMAMAMIIDQARDPDHVIIPIAGTAHNLGHDDLNELIRRQRTVIPGAQPAMLSLPRASSVPMPTSSGSATVPAAIDGSHATSPDHDHAGGS